LTLYVFFTIVILTLTASIYYNLQKELAASQNTIKLNEYSNDLLSRLKEKKAGIGKDQNFKISLYGEDYKLLHANSENTKDSLTEVSYTNTKAIRYITNPKEYYLNTQYIVVEIVDDQKWFHRSIKNILIYGTVFFLFMLFAGYYLLRLFLKPMRDAANLLERFIKDTTHELNTPVSTIMTNIELIDKESLENKYLHKAINRVEIGAKTISNIYDDLTYLILKHKILTNDRELNPKEIIEQRIEYFSTLANMKKIDLIVSLSDDARLKIDDKKFSKLIDNLLSNAIKYNTIKGSIYIELSQNSFSIRNTGKGIEQKNIDSMFERYTRFDKTVGGFGIGLNIVKMICDEYHMQIKIGSEIDKYTEVTIRF
jgi:two-component system OmpR family sensor kinase